MSNSDIAPIVGIDLGTTNSSVGVIENGQPRLIAVDGSVLLPSVVGRGIDGDTLVGQAARNQYVVYPDRTVRSIKRRMGEQISIALGEQQFTPVEISAMILRRLKLAAEAHLGVPIARAVITVPAYFSDAQRAATKDAGEVAGFTVERIINEPTAAALCYADPDSIAKRNLLVFDLGGGTFDVSIVRTRGLVTEVLSSHGDTKLGGDDFDERLLQHLKSQLAPAAQTLLEGDRRAEARLRRAAESAKIRLSTDSYVRVVEEQLVVDAQGVASHLDVEVSRATYEELIEPLIEKTKDSVQIALHEAQLLAKDLDEVILVGGASRTPIVTDLLVATTGLTPRQDVNPDEAVALGATLMSARLAGHHDSRILVDVTPFSFGTSYFGVLNGTPSPDCYRAIIHRNTPLPTQKSDVFQTIYPGQERVHVSVFQGESRDARENIQLGEFTVQGLDRTADEDSPIVFQMKLTLDGLLEVEVREHHTGLRKQVTIEDAFRRLTDDERSSAQARVRDLVGADVVALGAASEARALEPVDGEPSGAQVHAATDDLPDLPAHEGLSAAEQDTWSRARDVLRKAFAVTPTLPETDRAEVQELSASLKSALAAKQFPLIQQASEQLADALFFLE